MRLPWCWGSYWKLNRQVCLRIRDRFYCSLLAGNPGLLWPPFNVADSAITVGAISILISGVVGRDRES